MSYIGILGTAPAPRYSRLATNQHKIYREVLPRRLISESLVQLLLPDTAALLQINMRYIIIRSTPSVSCIGILGTAPAPRYSRLATNQHKIYREVLPRRLVSESLVQLLLPDTAALLQINIRQIEKYSLGALYRNPWYSSCSQIQPPCYKST